MHIDEIVSMIEQREFIELPICPFCNNMTDMRGEFLPCCGEPSKSIDKIKLWVRLNPIGVTSHLEPNDGVHSEW